MVVALELVTFHSTEACCLNLQCGFASQLFYNYFRAPDSFFQLVTLLRLNFMACDLSALADAFLS